MDIPDSRVTSQSMMNVFDDSITVVNGAHTDANNSNSFNIVNQTDDDNDKMSKMSVKEYMESVFGSGIKEDTSNLPFTEKVRRFLRSNYVHIAVIVLVLLDSFCVTIELITDLEDKSEKFKVVEDIFKYLGFSILCIFVVEISLKILFLFKEFIKSKLEIFDAVIVIVSFVIEVVFMNSDSPLAAIGGIIALFRFWRIIRIVNGIILAVEKRAEAKMEKLKDGLNALIKENENLKNELAKKQAIIDDLTKKV